MSVEKFRQAQAVWTNISRLEQSPSTDPTADKHLRTNKEVLQTMIDRELGVYAVSVLALDRSLKHSLELGIITQEQFAAVHKDDDVALANYISSSFMKRERKAQALVIFDEQVKTLRQAGKTNEQIAIEVDSSIGRVYGAVRRLISKGELSKINKQARLLNKLKALQAENPNQTVVLEEIAQEVGMNSHYAHRLYRKFDADNEPLPPLKKSVRSVRSVRIDGRHEFFPISGKRAILLDILRQHAVREPDLPIPYNLGELGQMLGVTKERARQLLNGLYSQFADELPPRPPRYTPFKVARKDLEILDLIKKGITQDQIIERLDITRSTFQQTRLRLIEKGKLTPRESKYKNIDPRIIELREQGLGDAKITEIVSQEFPGLKTSQIEAQINVLRNKGKLKRLRRKYRTRNELMTFDQQVKKLREEGLSYAQIAEKLNTSISDISVSVRRLLAGRIHTK